MFRAATVVFDAQGLLQAISSWLAPATQHYEEALAAAEKAVKVQGHATAAVIHVIAIVSLKREFETKTFPAKI